MKSYLAAVLGTSYLAWRWKRGSGARIGLLEGALGLAGIATFLFGLSFARGAMEEGEPEAARKGLLLFGAKGLAMIAVAEAMIRAGNRE